jgi:DNA topoisomerase-1
VLALVIALLDRTHMRVGNDEYAKANRTFGLTTLRDRHVRFDSGGLRLCFVGKGGKDLEVCVGDAGLARLVRRCRDVPGQQLFQWVDADGTHRPVGSTEVNGRIRELTGLDATAKTFRTWAATVRAAERLAVAGEPATAREAKATVLEAVDEVAGVLGNTRAVARASYVHPAVIGAYEAGRLTEWWADGPSRAASGLHPEERRLLLVLRRARRAGVGTAPAPRRRARAA